MPSRRFAFAAIAALAPAAIPPALAQSAPAGQALYQAYCLVCHGNPPAGGPERAANDPARIRRAVTAPTGVPAMSFLSFLSNAQLADIAAWIATAAGAPPAPGNPQPALDYTDLWYDPAESGWGFNIVQHAGTNSVFAVMYAYEAPGRPLWFVLPGGAWATSVTFAGTLYRVSGPPYDRPFDPGLVRPRAAGSASITFTGPGTAILTYTLDGATVTKSLVRQPF